MNAKLGASRMLGTFILFAAGATLGVLAATPIDDGLRILATTWTLCLGIHALGMRARVQRVAVKLDGEIVLETRAGSVAGVLRDGCFVAPFLAIIRWRPEGGRRDRTLVIAPDQLSEREFRALRVLLRWR